LEGEVAKMKKPISLRDSFLLTIAGALAMGSSPAWADVDDVVKEDKSRPSQGEQYKEPIQVAQKFEKTSAVPKDVEPKAGKVVYTDIRDWSQLEIDEAPFAASGQGRMALIIYGTGENAKKASAYVAKLFATKKHIEVGYLEAPDNDDNPNNSHVRGFADGSPYFNLKIGAGVDLKTAAKMIIIGMNKAYQAEFGNKAVVEAKDDGQKQENIIN
jgi:hypothetical protein